MGTCGLFKRFIPFLLTFAAGLLIASFFVPLTGPNFSFAKRRQYIRQLETENQRLRDKIEAQDAQIRELRESSLDSVDSIDWNDEGHPRLMLQTVPYDAPPPPPAAPKAPAPVKRAK
jgi:hypothetical protein